MDTEYICEAVRKLSFNAKALYILKAFAKLFDDSGIEIDIKNHLAKLNGNKALIQIDIGFNDKIWYSAGKFIWALREALTGIEQPKMIDTFPSSMYYDIEVMKHTDEAIRDILDYFK